MKKYNVYIKFFIVFLSLFIILFAVNSTFAKYISSVSKNQIQKANDFYFSSKKMSDNPNVTLFGGGVQSFVVDANNFTDALNINEFDISYNLSITATNSYTNFTATVNGNSTTTGTLLGGSANTDNISISLLSGYIDETVVTITLSSSSPYTKTMSMNVLLRTIEPNKYFITDSASALSISLFLTITTPVATDTMTITWDNSLFSIDNTNVYFLNATTKLYDANNVYYLIKLDSLIADSSIEIVFFKTDSTQNYSSVTTEILSNTISLGL